MDLPEHVDRVVHDRLIDAGDDGDIATVAPEALAAVVAFLIGTIGHDETAALLRDWADAVQRREIMGHA